MKLIGFVKLLVLVPLLMLFSCGGGEVSSIFDGAKLAYNEQTNYVEFTVNLNSDSNFEMEVLLPVQQYGTLHVIPQFNDEPAKVIIGLNVDLMGISGIMTDKLPNGAKFPSFVQGELLQVKIEDKYYAYVSLDPIRYIGFAIIMDSLNEFPAGSYVSSRFKNETGTIGAGVVYGPSADGSNSGGMFAVANIETLIDNNTSDTVIADSIED